MYVIMSPIFSYWDGNGWVSNKRDAKAYDEETLPESIFGVSLLRDGEMTEWRYVNHYVTYRIESV